MADISKDEVKEKVATVLCGEQNGECPLRLFNSLYVQVAKRDFPFEELGYGSMLQCLYDLGFGVAKGLRRVPRSERLTYYPKAGNLLMVSPPVVEEYLVHLLTEPENLPSCMRNQTKILPPLEEHLSDDTFKGKPVFTLTASLDNWQEDHPQLPVECLRQIILKQSRFATGANLVDAGVSTHRRLIYLRYGDKESARRIFTLFGKIYDLRIQPYVPDDFDKDNPHNLSETELATLMGSMSNGNTIGIPNTPNKSKDHEMMLSKDLNMLQSESLHAKADSIDICTPHSTGTKISDADSSMNSSISPISSSSDGGLVLKQSTSRQKEAPIMHSTPRCHTPMGVTCSMNSELPKCGFGRGLFKKLKEDDQAAPAIGFVCDKNKTSGTQVSSPLEPTQPLKMEEGECLVDDKSSIACTKVLVAAKRKLNSSARANSKNKSQSNFVTEKRKGSGRSTPIDERQDVMKRRAKRFQTDVVNLPKSKSVVQKNANGYYEIEIDAGKKLEQDSSDYEMQKSMMERLFRHNRLSLIKIRCEMSACKDVGDTWHVEFGNAKDVDTALTQYLVLKPRISQNSKVKT